MDYSELSKEQQDRLWVLLNPRRFELSNDDHACLLVKDSDWGGPTWWWGECSCSWKGTVFSDSSSAGSTPGTVMDVIKEMHLHVGIDTGALVNDAVMAVSFVADEFDDLGLAVNAEVARFDASGVLSVLDQALDELEEARQRLFDAVLVHQIVTG